jgi:hypothetical protein
VKNSEPRPELDFDRNYEGCNEITRSAERCEHEYWQVDFIIPSGIFPSGLKRVKVKLWNVTHDKSDDLQFW